MQLFEPCVADNCSTPIRNFLGLSDAVSFAAWQQPHMCVTAAVGGIAEFSSRAVAVLTATQNDDGSWPAYWWFEPAYTTALAVELLTTHNIMPACVRKSNGWARTQWMIGDKKNAFVLALLLKIFKCSGDEEHAAACTADLLALQQESGSWRGGARLRVPRPDDMQPADDNQWMRWFGAGAGTVWR